MGTSTRSKLSLSSEVSGLIPCYNAGRFLRRSVGSLQEQTIPLKEIIIVDDGSTDEETPKVIKELEDEGAVRCIRHKENRGPSASRNTGFSAAQTDYVLILDADDEFDPRLLELALSKLSNKTGAVGAYAKFIYDDWVPKRAVKSEPIIGGGVGGALFQCNCDPNGLIRKKAWSDIGGFDEELRYAEDHEFWIRFTASGWRTLMLPLHLRYYHRRAGSITTSTKEAIILKSYEYIYRKHKRLYEKYFFSGLWYVIKRSLINRRFPIVDFSPSISTVLSNNRRPLHRITLYVWRMIATAYVKIRAKIP